MIVFGSDQERYRCLVEASSLTVPLLDGVERAFASQVEHEEDSHGVVAHQGKHVDKFSLPTKIPDGEGDLRVAD